MTSKPDTGAPKGGLYAALAAARERCKPAEKASKNEHHRYKYASAEAILETANEALHGTGLSVTPLSQTIARRECGDVLVCTFRLACGSETVDAVKEWPVVPGNGRPMDKAVASADTTALGYFLRDLLLMPRVDETDDMDHPSRDREQQRRPTPPKRPQGGGRPSAPTGPIAPVTTAEARAPSPPSAAVEGAARRLGRAAFEAVHFVPGEPLTLEHERDVMDSIHAKGLIEHPLVVAFIKKHEPGWAARPPALSAATVEEWRTLIASLAKELESTK